MLMCVAETHSLFTVMQYSTRWTCDYLFFLLLRGMLVVTICLLLKIVLPTGNSLEAVSSYTSWRLSLGSGSESGVFKQQQQHHLRTCEKCKSFAFHRTIESLHTWMGGSEDMSVWISKDAASACNDPLSQQQGKHVNRKSQRQTM